MDRREFWENKIIKWENAKYDRSHWIDFNSSLKKRQSLSLELMKQVIPGRVVVEYGCGTGRMMDSVLEIGAKKYFGVDFSSAAIRTAKMRVRSSDAIRTELICSPIEGLAPIPADLSFSLGLMDWVEPKEVARLSAPLFLHSFSELRPASWQQAAHRAYSQWINIKGHRPAYFRKEDLQKVFYRPGIQFYQNSHLSFGGFIHNLS